MDPGELTPTRCTVCGQSPTGLVSRSLRGEIACRAHREVLWCSLCAHVGPVAEQATWSTVYDDIPRCPACTREAVRDQHDVRRELPAVRARARDIGFVLRTPVRVNLVTGDIARDHPDGLAYGMTLLTATDSRAAEVIMIRVLTGLPATLFRLVVAHELGHAWLAQHGSRPTEQAIEEGFCELLAHASLKHVHTPFAAGLLDRIRANPDPVYGDGFRQVQSAVRRHGMKKLLASLAATGTLPVAKTIGLRSVGEA